MFLKSLTLKGFKSFAETTTLDFEPGVTVVVGPNGSGKSNIVDAVAWVLGAQGPRTVRSTKMEDVIFAGTPKRPALGRAEVSLTIDNQAGILPIGFSEVTLTRTLFRSGDSEYAINGAPCRLLDVQELLSDTGVGRQQHVIVSQGQLDAILSSRPEDRRLIIEEAAGILKFRRRKERAERRLESTEGSLLRLQDLLREVRRQRRPLEHQADAARRHDGLAEELQALRQYLAGRELAALETRSAAARGGRADLVRAEDEQRSALGRLDQGIAEAENELSMVRQSSAGIDLGDALSRAERLGATARGLLALIGERQRSSERDRLATLDENVVANLEAEAVGLVEALRVSEEEAAALVPRFDELIAAEAAFESDARDLEADRVDADAHTDGPVTEAGARAPAGAKAAGEAEVRAELVALRRGLDSGHDELGRLDRRLAALGLRLTRLDEELAELEVRAAEAETAQPGLLAAVAEIEQDRLRTAATLAAAEDAKHQVDLEHHRWSARAEALALGLDEARARAGAERLAGIDGVVGTLLEVVDIDDGWAAAFEAAAGEAAAAILVDDVPAARRSLGHLREQKAAGVVLPLAQSPAARSPAAPPGPAAPAAVARSLPGEAVRAHVRARQREAEAFLDHLLATAVVVDGGWMEALDAAIAAPDLVVVTLEGDRFTATGWCTGAGSTGATGAALEHATEQADRTQRAAAALAADVATGRAALTDVAREEAERVRRRDGNEHRRGALFDAIERAGTERRDLVSEKEALDLHRRSLIARLAGESERITELDQLLPGLEELAAFQARRALAERARRARLAERSAALAALRRDIEVRAAGLEQRRGMLTSRLAEIEGRLRHHADQRQQVAARREAWDRAAIVTERLTALVAARSHQLNELVVELRSARSQEVQAVHSVSSRLDQLRSDRSSAERRLTELRERLARIQLEETEGQVRLEALVETIRRELECEPDRTRDAECPPLPPGTSPRSRARELEREIRLMGPINPLALEEYAALQERQAFLEAQLDDVRSARRELGKVIRMIDGEIVEVFRAAYADVAENFERLFTTLFPGGQGRLRLTDPDHLLETGIEVEARPSGKNIRRLSLLSGGERSLTALALLFAVFRSRPSPFYLMDEVEAALDDVNLLRFLDLLREFRDEAQLVVVSHQKRTMEAADWLYGVTMQPGGSSRVISERITAGT